MTRLSGFPVPPISPLAATALEGHGQLGKDLNGKALYTDRVAWVERNYEDRDEQDLMLRLFVVFDRTQAPTEEEIRECQSSTSSST